MGVKFDVWLNTTEEEILAKFNGNELRAELFWARHFYPHLNMLINDLYDRGLIDDGHYVIDIDW
jgi:hypothetical protein